MDSLHYIQKYMAARNGERHAGRTLAIRLITNFTDDVLEKILGGMCIEEGIRPEIVRTSYKQYALALKNPQDELYAHPANITFVFFDVNPYEHSEFADPLHVQQTLADIRAYSLACEHTVILSLALTPYQSPYGLHFENDPLYQRVAAWNSGCRTIAAEIPAVHIFDTNRIAHRVGEERLRDLRGLYAFDMPFSNDFLVALCHDWFSYIHALFGSARKCIVLDLDNTLWGGVVGETGALGIALGPGYPGRAFQNFQRALKKMADRGVLLALASKNNEEDAREVFNTNPHMVLTENDFAAMRINWDDKSENLQSIAAELNIGLDSFVFIDDSPLERELVRRQLPMVMVPEFSLSPEQWPQILFSFNVFHQMVLTDEDRNKNSMYVQERKRKEVHAAAKNLKDYIKELNITITIREGSDLPLARVAQLTQKTNQFNLTTRRYTEAELAALTKKGARIFAGDVRDRFGEYGTVVLAIITSAGSDAFLDTFLMSCRVMGRGVENVFFEHILNKLAASHVSRIQASFIPTTKNKPAADFLPSCGFTPERTGAKHEIVYSLALPRNGNATLMPGINVIDNAL